MVKQRYYGFFLKMVKISTLSCCNYYLCANTCSTLIQIVFVPRVYCIYLDQGRIGVCVQRIITTLASTIFNHFKNKPYYYGFTNIILHLCT
jgi:hypothetical protein